MHTPKLFALACLLLAASSVSATCLNPLIFNYSGTGTNDYTLVNVSLMSAYVDANLTRVNVTSGNEWWMYDDYRLLVKTDAGNEAFTVGVYDSTFNNTVGANMTVPDEIKNLQVSDFSSVAQLYTITFRQEEDGSLWSFDLDDTSELEVVCESYSPATVSLLSYNLTTIYLGTREDPRFRLRMDNNTYRERYITADSLVFDYYLPSDKSDLLNIDFTLQDYPGDYEDSILRLQRVYDDTFTDVISRTWTSTGEVNDVWVKPNVYYKILVTSGSTTLDKGLFKYSSDGSQDIRVTEPVITYGDELDEGIDAFAVWQNISTSRVYCLYSVNDAYSFTSATFTVYNSSVYPIDEIYTSSNVTTKNGSFSYLIPNASLRYTVSCDLIYQLGTVERTRTYSFANNTRFLDPGLPDDYEILGFTVIDWFKGISLFLTVFTLGLGSMINISYLFMLAAAELWLWDTFNWWDIHPVIIAFMLVFAVVFRFKQAREGFG